MPTQEHDHTVTDPPDKPQTLCEDCALGIVTGNVLFGKPGDALQYELIVCTAARFDCEGGLNTPHVWYISDKKKDDKRAGTTEGEGYSHLEISRILWRAAVSRETNDSTEGPSEY